MSKGGSSAPAAPNPITTANAQTASNQATALYQAGLNNTNQVTPYGNLTYTLGGTAANPQYTSTATLSPAEQALLTGGQANQQRELGLANTVLGQAQNTMSTPYSLAGLPQVAGNGDLSAYQNQISADVLSRINPQLDRNQEQLNQQLADQGVTAGSQAYNTAQQLMGQQKNDAYLQADLTGNQEAQNLFNESLAANQNAAQEYNTQYNEPLNAYTQLMSGVQPTTPSFASTGNTTVAPTNTAAIVQNAYNDQLQSTSANNATTNSQNSAILNMIPFALNTVFSL